MLYHVIVLYLDYVCEGMWGMILGEECIVKIGRVIDNCC